MGKNYFQAIPLKDSYQKKLREFTASLGNAIGKGETIPLVDNDLAYTLNLQNERIKEKGLEIDYEAYARNEDNRFFDIADWKDKHYASRVGFGVYGVKRTLKRDGKIIYKDKLRNDFFGTITDIVSGAHPDNDPYICPNCGADGTIAELQNGCPYCGTQYKMDDLFPKITGFYFFDSLGITKLQLLIGWPLSAIFCTILLYVYIINQLINPDAFKLLPFIDTTQTMTALLSGPIIGIAYGFFLFCFIHLLFKIARSIVDLWRMGTAASRKRFEYGMKKITPEFSFEYFQNKALSLVKMAVYSKDESELPFYKGEPLPAEMKDIIDLNYAGIIGLKRFEEKDGYVTAEIKGYFDILTVKDNKVKFTHPVYSATFKRRTDVPVNMNFTMTRINCPTCGTSFNAMKNKCCPSCGNEYELITDDWVLVEIKKA